MQIILNLSTYYMFRQRSIHPTYPQLIPRGLQGFIYDSQVITIIAKDCNSPR